MTKIFEISDDIYKFLDRLILEKENVKELIEYVHYKALLDSFTFIIEHNKDVDDNLDYLLPDYVEVISKIQIIINNIKNKYKEENGEDND